MARAIQLTMPLAVAEEGSRLPQSREEILQAMAMVVLSALLEEEQGEGGENDDDGE